MQLYNRGIRGRFAPMVNNDRKLLELANSVMFALPSSPFIRYGEEIGMGEKLSLSEREIVRTPMQWNTGLSGGFTISLRLAKGVIDTGRFSFKTINVKTEERDSSSLLVWTRKMILLRKLCPEIGFGTCEFLETGNDHVLVILYAWQGRRLLIVNNFSDKVEKISLRKRDLQGHALALTFPGKSMLPMNDLHVDLELSAYGYNWFRVR